MITHKCPACGYYSSGIHVCPIDKKGLTIIDAVKSGKRRKRACNPGWEKPDLSYIYRTEDILATDWEIEEKKIEITESEFDKALSESEQMYVWNGTNFITELKKRLFG